MVFKDDRPTTYLQPPPPLFNQAERTEHNATIPGVVHTHVPAADDVVYDIVEVRLLGEVALPAVDAVLGSFGLGVEMKGRGWIIRDTRGGGGPRTSLLTLMMTLHCSRSLATRSWYTPPNCRGGVGGGRK